jgi:hypothetical protein
VPSAANRQQRQSGGSWLGNQIQQSREHAVVRGRKPRKVLCGQSSQHADALPIAFRSAAEVDANRWIRLWAIERKKSVRHARSVHWLVLYGCDVTWDNHRILEAWDTVGRIFHTAWNSIPPIHVFIRAP